MVDMGKALEIKEKTKKEIKKSFTESIRQGSSIVKACQDAGISRSAYYQWLEIDGNFRMAVSWAMKSRVHLVADALFKACLEGDVTAQKFFLTNRSPEEWKEHKQLINQGIIQQGNDAQANITQIVFEGVEPDENTNPQENPQGFISESTI